VLFANPRRRRRRRRARARIIAYRPRHRRRRVHAAKPRRSRRRAYKAFAHMKRRRRRSNPGMIRLGKFGPVIKMAIFGGLGIVTARIGMHLYDKFLAKTVDGGSSSGARMWLGKIVRLVSGGVLVIAVDKGLHKARVSPQNCMAFKVGGIAETGRQAIGLAVKQLSPKTDLSQWGFNGYAGYDPRVLQAYGYDAGSFGDVEDGDSFMGDLEEGDSFMGAGHGLPRAGANHPFAHGAVAY
jgi:hypothetical protein